LLHIGVNWRSRTVILIGKPTTRIEVIAEPHTIRVPDVLGSGVRNAEGLHQLIRQAPYAPEYRFDVRPVDFVRPYGVLALLAAARQLAMTCGQPVRVAGMSEQLRLYLERMDLFKVCGEWMVPEVILQQEGWDRNPQKLFGKSGWAAQ
jgi:hypothetical protein